HSTLDASVSPAVEKVRPSPSAEVVQVVPDPRPGPERAGAQIDRGAALVVVNASGVADGSLEPATSEVGGEIGSVEADGEHRPGPIWWWTPVGEGVVSAVGGGQPKRRAVAVRSEERRVGEGGGCEGR